MKLQPITTRNERLYGFMEEVLTSSFPTEEYRPLAELRSQTDHTAIFHNNIIRENNLPVGILTYWEFPSFVFVEHLAICPNLHGNGYGSRALSCLCGEMNRPIVLEVERPDTPTARRRVDFYSRNGFVLWPNEYRQPPYRQGDDFIAMRLMAWGEIDAIRDYEMVKTQIYSAVYGFSAEKNALL